MAGSPAASISERLPEGQPFRAGRRSRVYRDHFIYKTAHFTVYDVEARGKTKIGDLELMDRQWATDVTLPGTRINLDVEIGEGYVDLKVTGQ